VTAEAIVLNKSAVAMAADSLVTITGGRGVMKSFDTANKLFELVKGRPVGVMTYSNAEINGVPWETVIKAYRRANAGAEFESLSEYAHDFISYLRSDREFLDEGGERYTFRRIAYETQLQVLKAIEGRLHECVTAKSRPIKSRIRAVAQECIAGVAESLESLDDAPWATELGDVGSILADYGAIAREVTQQVFGNMPLLQRDFANLASLCALACVKSTTFRSWSGLVFAGFGRSDAFPSVHEFVINGRLSGTVMLEEPPVVSITHDRGGDIRTFAQDRHAWSFLNGIDNEMRTLIMTELHDWVENSQEIFGRLLARTHPRLAAKTVASITELQHEMFDTYLHEWFLKRMQSHEIAHFRNPILDSIEFLPREELALLAESLVNLTSMWQRVSVHGQQTVGGEIDVALISHGDGLVWIKRKHYFSLDLNPAWPMIHSGIVQ